ncbi:MAG TPA: aminotransferase class III-fold pyridoxal phosphate-dependent enzyme [Hyphomicrobiaceae bacterium]|nr:aminotransferase class III-fold pyridoxal phosphate-dependent enzyme [Hyphomicrobiaceae bacterium]
MDSQTLAFLVAGLGGVVAAGTLAKAGRRLQLSRAKHASLAGHPRWAKRIAGLIPFYEFDAASFFSSDGAPGEVAARRQSGFEALARHYQDRFARTIALNASIRGTLSDLQFTEAYRVPYQYSRRVREQLGGSPLLKSSSGVELTDVDGNRFYDLAGSYGVNLFGYDFYKQCIERGAARVAELGPVLGAYHPVIAYNARRLREISGLDEVSFHMSGTEAVMQAVRLARYHTGRRKVVRFCGAYHGWWGDVQPGIGNPAPVTDSFTLADMSEASLKVLRTRRDIACVLVNPLQALHPNASAPADSALVDGGRRAGFEAATYAQWLGALREVCRQRRIVLIFDEVFVGFRLAPGGAQEYFGVKADIVTYGKTLGGGLPVGAVCGRGDLMRRFRSDRPADICFARGTFNSHPYVMGAMCEFLEQLDTPQVKALYADLEPTWNGRAGALNRRLADNDLPVRVANLSSIWTVYYTQPSRYHWMLQYYLRSQGLALSWVGTGRLVFSLNYSDSDFAAVAEKFVAAAEAMRADGWWWQGQRGLAPRPNIKRQILREMLQHRFAGMFGARTVHGR